MYIGQMYNINEKKCVWVLLFFYRFIYIEKMQKNYVRNFVMIQCLHKNPHAFIFLSC